MNSNQRQISLDQRTKDRNSTQLLEKILLSSSSSSSQRQKSIIMTTQEIASTQGGQTQRTQNQGFNMTGKNWRKLVTPAHDSFKKIQQQVTTTEQSQNFIYGSRHTGNEKVFIGVTTNSNNTSMDTGSLQLSVKEFTPSYDINLLKRTMKGEIDSNTQSQNFNESKQQRILQEESKMKKSSLENLASASSQMKSLIKSLSNGNFQFYDQLHKKYFDRAKDLGKSSMKPPTASQINLDKTSGGGDKDFLTLTNNTNTVFGLSQLNYTNSQNNFQNMKSSIESTDKNGQSAMRASSLNTKSQNRMSSKNTMSINFKNSLYKKINPTSALLEEHSQLQLRDDKYPNQNKSLIPRSKRNVSYLSSSSSDSDISEEKCQQPIDIQNHILRHQQEIFGKRQIRSKSREKQKRVNESLFSKLDKNALSRGDLSGRQDDLSASYLATPTNQELKQYQKNKQQLGFYKNMSKDSQEDSQYQQQLELEKSQYNAFTRNNNRQDKQLYDSQSSPNTFHQLLNSNNGDIKLGGGCTTQSEGSSILISNPDYLQNLQQSQFRVNEQSNIIFEQPNYENCLDNTYNETSLKDISNNRRDNYLKPEDLMSNKQTIDIDNNNESKVSSNDVFKTYQEHIKLARTKLNNDECNYLKRSYNSQNNSLTTNKKNEDKALVKKQVYNYQSEAPNRIKSMIPTAQFNSNQNNKQNHGEKQYENNNMKASNVFEDGQRSDFTFVLSNPTDFICDCTENVNNNSFVHQKPPQSAMQSEFKSQQHSSYRKKPQQQFKGFQNKLHEIVASPIYSDGTQNNFSCKHCGGCKGGAAGGLQSNRMSQIQHRLSYAHLNNCSIKEESNDEEEDGHPFSKKHLNQSNTDSNVEQSYDSGMKNKLLQLKQNGFQFPLMSNLQSSKQSSAQTDDRRRDTKNNTVNIRSQEQQYLNESSKQTQEEEIKNLRNIVSFSYECMSKIVQDNQVQTQYKQDLAKILEFISHISSVQQSNQFNKFAPSERQTSNSQEEFNQEKGGEEFEDENLTLSQLQQQKQQMSKQNIFNYVRKGLNQYEDRTNMDESYQSSSGQFTHRDQVPQVQMIKDCSPILPSQNKVIQQKLKGSLISSCEDQDQLRETIYSYFDQDDIDDQYLRKSGLKESQIRQHKALLQSQNHNFKNSQISNHSNGIIGITKVNGLKNSLRKTKKCLIQAKNELKKEKLLNRQQEDNLKKMQAQIEALTERWKITEDKIKSGENMYHIMQRTNNLLNQNSSNQTNPSTQQHYFKSVQQCTSSFLLQPHTNRTSPPISIQNNSIQTQNTQPSKDSANGKSLNDINDRLTQQIENNIQLFENLNTELCEKEKEIEQNQNVLQEKDKEIEQLTRKINEMSQNMKQLMDIAQVSSNSTTTYSSKQKHQDEIEQIKKKQLEYEKKILNLENTFSNSSQPFFFDNLKSLSVQRKALQCIQLSTLKKDSFEQDFSQKSDTNRPALHENDFLPSCYQLQQNDSNKENKNQEINFQQSDKSLNQTVLKNSSKVGKQSSIFNESSDLKYSIEPSFQKTLKQTYSTNKTKIKKSQ